MSTAPLSLIARLTPRGPRRDGGVLPAALTLLFMAASCLAPAPSARAQVGPPAPGAALPPLQFILTYDGELAGTDRYTGPVYIVFATGGPPRMVPRNFGRDPIVVVDVEDWRPDTPLMVDAGNARSAPMDFGEITPGRYFIQAFLPINPDSFKPGDDANLGSQTIPTKLETFETMPMQLHLDRPLEPLVLGGSSDRIVTEAITSAALSAFHGEPITIEYTVTLPPGYDFEPDRRYPARIWLGSHGTGHRVGSSALRPLERFEGGNDIITVLVEITSRFGHPLFVDSASSGPWETAFMEELLPRIETVYRIDPKGRFLTGHAGGAWAALWLQINHPDEFAATYAIAPWPTSFESWFGINLYEDANALTKEDGSRAYGYLADGRPAEPAADTWRREDLLVDGGPFRSFEWAFSPPREDGNPQHFFDRRTGEIDREVIEHWARWDLTRLIERRGEELAPALAGKITLRVGGQDGYRLDEPTRRFAEAMTAAGIEFTDEFQPEGRHGDIANLPYQMAVMKAMVDRYVASRGGVEAMRRERLEGAGAGGGAAADDGGNSGTGGTGGSAGSGTGTGG